MAYASGGGMCDIAIPQCFLFFVLSVPPQPTGLCNRHVKPTPAFSCIAFVALLKTYLGMNQAFKLPVYAVGAAALPSAVIRRDAKFPHEVGKRFAKLKPGL